MAAEMSAATLNTRQLANASTSGRSRSGFLAMSAQMTPLETKSPPKHADQRQHRRCRYDDLEGLRRDIGADNAEQPNQEIWKMALSPSDRDRAFLILGPFSISSRAIVTPHDPRRVFRGADNTDWADAKLCLSTGRSGRRPGIVLFSEIFQRTGPIGRMAAMLAGNGFVVVVPEIFHRARTGRNGARVRSSGRRSRQP